MNRGIAVVTGGTAGLGRAIVRELASRGWDIAVLARGEDGLAGTVADIDLAGRRGLGVVTDVADRGAVERAAARVEAELGPIDLWVNNAMTGLFGDFLAVDPDDFERATRVNYLGVVNGTRAALSRMVPRGRGHIVQVGSALAHRGIPLQSSYCAAKHAVKGFTESLTSELIANGSDVRLSTVDMPALNTIQFSWVRSLLPDHPQPVAPIYEPEVGARAVADVVDRPRRRTWLGGSTVLTVLGNRIAPWFMDTYLARTAYEGQQAPDVEEPMLPSNLYEPAPGDHGARGVFSDTARMGGPQTWAIAHRRAATAIVVGLGALAVIAVSTLAARTPK